MRFYFLFLFLLFFRLVTAQVEGIKIYTTTNYFWLESKIQEDLVDGSLEVNIENGDYGFDIGYGLLYRVKDIFLLETDFNYSDRFRNQFDPFGTKQTVKYIGIHQKLFLDCIKAIKPYLGIGTNYLIVKRSSADIDFNSNRSFYSNWDIALHVGFVIRISSFEIFTDFQYGLNPQRKIANFISLGTEEVVNSKSRLIRAGVSYIIQDQEETTKARKRKKRKRKRRG